MWPLVKSKNVPNVSILFFIGTSLFSGLSGFPSGVVDLFPKPLAINDLLAQLETLREHL